MPAAIRPVVLAIIFCGVVASLVSCSNDDNLPEPELQGYSGVPLIILDTDIGSSTDDLFALMMLYRYQEQNKSRLLGVVVDREGEDFAACYNADFRPVEYGYFP